MFDKKKKRSSFQLFSGTLSQISWSSSVDSLVSCHRLTDVKYRTVTIYKQSSSSSVSPAKTTEKTPSAEEDYET